MLNDQGQERLKLKSAYEIKQKDKIAMAYLPKH